MWFYMGIIFNNLSISIYISNSNNVTTNINWIVAGQPDGRRLNVIKSFYVKFERKIPEVVADFCTYYASHRN